MRYCLIIFTILGSYNFTLSQNLNDSIVTDILDKFLAANVNVKNSFKNLEPYLCPKNIEVIDEATKIQMNLETYFKSFNKSQVIKLKSGKKNKKYYYKIPSSKNEISFIRIINGSIKTYFILKLKYKKRRNKFCIYRIDINNLNIYQIVESNENPAYIGVNIGGIYNSEIISDNLNISRNNFYIFPVGNISFGHRITGAKPLKGIKFNYGISFTSLAKNMTFENKKNITSENSFPFKNITINKSMFYSINFGINWYIRQSFWFKSWTYTRYDFYIQPNIAWSSYKFSSEKIKDIEYNFVVQNFVFGICGGFEYWLDPSLRWSSFIDFSYIGKIENTYTNMKIPSSFGLNLGIKYNFY